MSRRLNILLVFVSILVVGCNFSTQEEVTLTPDLPFEEPIVPLPNATDTPIFTDTPTITPTQTLTLTPTTQPTEVAQEPTPTQTEALPPTDIPLPEPTLGPWEYVVQPNETLIEIIQREPFNYRTLDVIQEIVRINPNVLSADFLPVGETILIPRPTASAVEAPPEAIAQAEEPEEVAPNNGPVIPDIETRANVFTPPGYVISPYQVRAGETIIGLVERNDGLTLAGFAQLNAAISFSGCNFELPGGGPNCNPIIGENQWVNILRPAPPPTPTSTPTGDETATPTPTFAPPAIISPPDGASASGLVRLSWASVGLLKPEQAYVITVRDLTAGVVWSGATRATNLLLPAELIPSSGQNHEIEWSITIGVRTEDGGEYRPTNAGTATHRFFWRSR